MRGVAILLVVLHHIGMRLPLKHSFIANWVPIRYLNPFNYNGYEAVFVFFVISGFLITHMSLQRWGSLDKINLKDFYLRRFARIMPCLLLLVIALSILHMFSVKYYTISNPTQSLGGAIFSALTMHLNWYEGQTGWLPGGWDVLWSLSIEEVFYLGFPLLCLLVSARKVLVALLIVLALWLPFTRAVLSNNEIWQEKAYLPAMSAIATGVLTAMLTQYLESREFRNRNRIVQWLRVFGAFGLIAIFFYEDLLWRSLKDGSLLILTFSSAGLILSFHLQQPKPPLPVCGTGWISTMGRQSYEIYLMHMFIVFGILEVASIVGTPKAVSFFWYIPTVLLSWLLGAALERWYSRPCDLYLRDNFLKR